MVSAATILCWNQTINQRGAAIAAAETAIVATTETAIVAAGMVHVWVGTNILLLT
jgi:hypothetical protein